MVLKASGLQVHATPPTTAAWTLKPSTWPLTLMASLQYWHPRFLGNEANSSSDTLQWCSWNTLLLPDIRICAHATQMSIFSVMQWCSGTEKSEIRRGTSKWYRVFRSAGTRWIPEGTPLSRKKTKVHPYPILTLKFLNTPRNFRWKHKISGKCWG